MAEDDDDDVNNNSTSAQFGMPLQSSSTRTTDGSSGEPTEHNSNSGNGDETSGQGSIRKPFRPRSPVLEGNSAEAALPTNGADAVPASPEKENCFVIDWDALDSPPELFDQNGDRQSLTCSGGKRPKTKQLPPPTYLWNIGSTRKVEDIEEDEEVEENHISETTVELLKRLHRTLDEEDLKKYVPNTGDCLICSDDNCLLAIPQCNCREPCCHSCMFTHLEASYARGQAFLCPFCQQPPNRLYYNIKSTYDYRIWVVHKFEPYTALYPLIRAIGLFALENSELCGDGMNPLTRITYVSFISTIMRTPETDDLLILDPKQWFRAFVYIHDLIPWNYSAAQCTLPLPLCDEHVKHELERLKDFLGAELCYFYSTLNLPLDFDEDKMNSVLVQMRALVNGYASVQEYFERGDHFQNALTNLIPTDWMLKDDIVNFNINMPKKIYTESLHFLNSRAPSLDTYIKRVIYTNLPSDQLIYDPCLSRRESRMLRTTLLVASNSRLNAAYEDRKREIETEDQLRQERMAQIMEIIHRRAQDVANEDVNEDNEGSDVLRDGAAPREIDSRANEAFQINIVNLYLQSFGIDLDIYEADDPEESNELDIDLDGPIHLSHSSRDSVNLTPTGSDEDILEHESQNVTESENPEESRLSFSINPPTSSSSSIVLESVPMQSEQQASMQNSNLLADIADYGSMNWSLCRENVSVPSEPASSQPPLPGSSLGPSSEVAADGAVGDSSRHPHEERIDQMIEQYMAESIDTTDRLSPTREVGDSLHHSNGDEQSNGSINSSIIASNEAGPPVRQSSVDPTRSPSRHSLDVGAPGKLDNSPTNGDEVEKLRTACIDQGPGYKYFMRRIYPEESDGDSDSDDEYITMRGKPSQWRRAKRSNPMRNGPSGPSGSTNRPAHGSPLSPGQCMASTSGINSRQQQDDQVSPRDMASTSKVHLDYSDSDSD